LEDEGKKGRRREESKHLKKEGEAISPKGGTSNRADSRWQDYLEEKKRYRSP